LDPLLDRDQKGGPREKVPTRPGVLERPDWEALGERKESSRRGATYAPGVQRTREKCLCARRTALGAFRAP